MAGIDDILAAIPLGDLAKKLGVDENVARSVASQALPALLGGMKANADAGGEASLEKAVQSHRNGLLEGGLNLDDVDENDGEKIVDNVFGDKKKQVVSTLAETTPAAGGGLGDIVGKALPILAPIVMSYLAQRAAGGSSSSGGGIGGLLGGLLGGGGSSAPATSASSGGLGDILSGLGALLGGGKK